MSLLARLFAFARIESRNPRLIGMALYNRLVLAAGTCGIVLGAAMISDSRESMYFIPITVFSLLAPIGMGLAFWKLGMASRAGSSRAFHASWLFAGALTVPVGVAAYLLVLDRRPLSVLQELPQMSVAERIALAALTAGLPILAAIVAVGVRVRAALQNE